MFAEDMMLYMEKSEHFTKKLLLKLISEFRKVAGYKTDIQK